MQSINVQNFDCHNDSHRKDRGKVRIDAGCLFGLCSFCMRLVPMVFAFKCAWLERLGVRIYFYAHVHCRFQFKVSIRDICVWVHCMHMHMHCACVLRFMAIELTHSLSHSLTLGLNLPPFSQWFPIIYGCTANISLSPFISCGFWLFLLCFLGSIFSFYMGFGWICAAAAAAAVVLIIIIIIVVILIVSATLSWNMNCMHGLSVCVCLHYYVLRIVQLQQPWRAEHIVQKTVFTNDDDDDGDVKCIVHRNKWAELIQQLVLSHIQRVFVLMLVLVLEQQQQQQQNGIMDPFISLFLLFAHIRLLLL